uniref:probable RNA-binding protein 18 n=1 Tax=Myxine glutinosa TaxID=7769 RepID=UPI00358E18DA
MDKKREASQLAIDSAAVLSEGCRHDGHRLWIGNLDLRLSEYHLLRLLKRIGTVRQFDFLFHRSGPLEGQPRGYCFVNFNSKQEAERAIEKLNGKLALSRPLVVRWAHAQQQPTYERQREPNLPSSLEPSATETEPPCASSLTLSAKIQAIEAKLRLMDQQEDLEPPVPVLSRLLPKPPTSPNTRGGRGRRGPRR